MLDESFYEEALVMLFYQHLVLHQGEDNDGVKEFFAQVLLNLRDKDKVRHLSLQYKMMSKKLAQRGLF